MSRNINYSIIIPHKNIPALLQRCLDSIPRREDVQIIIVDDNSDPKIVDFYKFPGLNDPFVEVVFTKEGRGAGYARNVGLTKAAGKWTLFLDADDFYNYCIRNILDEYVNSDADIIYFKFNSVDCEMYTTTNRCDNFNKYIDYWLNSHKKDDAFLRYKIPSVLSKIHRTELIKKSNILFDEVSMSNDITFAYLSGFFAASVSADTRALYCTTIRQGSIRHRKKSMEMKLDDLYVVCKRYLFYKKNNIPVSTNIIRVNSIFSSYFFDKCFFNKSVTILRNLEFSPGDMIKLFLYCIFIFNPKIIIKKIYTRIKNILKRFIV